MSDPNMAPDASKRKPGDTHTRSIFRFLKQVGADRQLHPHPAAFRVAFEISQHINRRTGEAWPSQVKLAASTGTTVRTIRREIERLRLRGHLHVEVGRGRRKVSRYRMIIMDTEKRTPASAFPDTEKRTPTSGLAPAEKRTCATPNSGHGCPTNHLNRTIPSNQRRADSRIEGEFEEDDGTWPIDPVRRRERYLKDAEVLIGPGSAPVALQLLELKGSEPAASKVLGDAAMESDPRQYVLRIMQRVRLH